MKAKKYDNLLKDFKSQEKENQTIKAENQWMKGLLRQFYQSQIEEPHKGFNGNMGGGAGNFGGNGHSIC